MTETASKGDEQVLKPSVQLQDVSNVLNTDNGTNVLDVESYHKSDYMSKDCLVKSDTMQVSESDKKVNAMPLFATLDVDCRKLSIDSLYCNKSQSGLQKLFVAKAGNRIKTSAAAGNTSFTKAFCWSNNRFGFQKSKNITSFNRSDALAKDFKNPFRKTNSSPKDEMMQQATDKTSVIEAPTSASSLLSVEEEEEMVDDPSPVDSGLELGTLASPHQQPVSFEISDVGASAFL